MLKDFERGCRCSDPCHWL